jgi:hypothetical protein
MRTNINLISKSTLGHRWDVSLGQAIGGCLLFSSVRKSEELQAAPPSTLLFIALYKCSQGQSSLVWGKPQCFQEIKSCVGRK